MTHRLKPQEAFTADAIERVVRHEWEPREVRDARDGSGLRVDCTYGEAVALELTGLYDPQWMAAAEEVTAAATRLTAAARANGWGGWLVGVTMPARIRDAEAAAFDLIADGKEIDAGAYRSQDMDSLSPDEAQAVVQHHRALRALGLSQVRRRLGTDTVTLLLDGPASRLEGFGHLLVGAISRKKQVLHEARPRETHLGVLVVRWDVSDVVGETPPPELPAEVDVLWVVRPGRGSLATHVWQVGRGQANWTVHQIDDV